MPPARRTISRRRLLRWAASLGLVPLAHTLLGKTPTPAQAARAREPAPLDPVDDLPYKLYVPFVSAPPPIAAHGPSKLGLHTIRPNNALGFTQGVRDAGATLALVKAVDDFGYLRWVKAASPQTTTIGRSDVVTWVEPSGDPAEKASQVMSQHMARWRYEKDVVDYWEVLNENDPPTVEGHVWLARFYIGAMNVAEANGYRLALFSYSVGVPQWTEWEAIVETGVFARARQGGHILALHEYNYPTMSDRWNEPLQDQPAYEDRGVLTGRYRYLYRDFLIPRDEVIPLAITEGGLDPVLWQPGQPLTWKERLVEEMIWYDTRLREDDYVIGAATFTVGGSWGWEMYDFEDLLPDFHAHIVSLKDG